MDNENTETEIEKVFKAACDEHLAEIKAKADAAAKLMDEACELSEKYGIPFRPELGPFTISYFPESFEEKFSDIDTNFVYKLTKAYCDDFDNVGWQTSQIC